MTKKYAREIAQLKARLAEKDAQLLGGFGAPSNLGLEEFCIDDVWEKDSTSQESQALPALHSIPSSSQLIKGSGSSGLVPKITGAVPSTTERRGSSENEPQPFKNDNQPKTLISMLITYICYKNGINVLVHSVAVIPQVKCRFHDPHMQSDLLTPHQY